MSSLLNQVLPGPSVFLFLPARLKQRTPDLLFKTTKACCSIMIQLSQCHPQRGGGAVTGDASVVRQLDAKMVKGRLNLSSSSRITGKNQETLIKKQHSVSFKEVKSQTCEQQR